MDLKYWDKLCSCGNDKILKVGLVTETTIFYCPQCNEMFSVPEWGIMNGSETWIKKQ
jgi:hypothetical protein